MPYILEIKASGGSRLRLLDDDHDVLADAIMRGAGGVRLLRRIVDPGGEARFSAEEVVVAGHEVETLRLGLDPDEAATLAPLIERLAGLFAEARRLSQSVSGQGEP